MKERLKAGVLKESAKNKDVNGGASVRDIKDEVKEEAKGHSAGSTPEIKPPSSTPDIKPPLASSLDVKPPSNKMANGEADTPKSEDSNKNKIVTEGIKEENGGPMSVGSDNKKSPAGAGSMGTPGGPGAPSARPDLSVPGFIQQQSQIFVFNSAMANQAAESVKQGKYKNIISYHMEQHSSQQAMNQRGQNKPGPGGRTPTYPGFPGKPGMPGMGPEMGGPGMGCPPNSMAGVGMGSTVEQWVQEQNANLQQQQAMSGMPSYPMTSSGMVGPNGPGPGAGPNPMYPQGMMGGPGPMGGPGGFPMMESAYEFNPDAVGPGGAVSMPHINLSQNKVPNESLTPEQLKNRSEKLRGLSKIKGSLEMRGLLDSGGPPDMFMGGNMSSQQAMLSQQQAMMSQHQAMMSGMGPGQGPHPGMMSPSQQYMMQQPAQHMGMEGPFQPGHPANFRGQGPGPGPGMSGDMNPHQAWVRMQQEYYESKTKMMQHQQRSQQAAMMGGMGPQHPLSGPPPPYYSTMGGKRQPVPPMGMVGSPTSPSPMMDGGVDPIMFPTARSRGMPMDPQAMEAMGPAGFVPGPSGMPPHSMGMGMMPGMEGPMMPGMGPQGPMVSGPMMPSRVGTGPMMCSTSGVSVVSSTSSRKTAGAPPQVTLHRAGNPEQFTPEPNSANMNSSGSKPPPSYAQAQKRKRDDMEDPFKNLQPTPSPTPLTYLNQFEGQELTITKQLNSAFRDSTTGTGPSAGAGVGSMTPHDPGSVPPSSQMHNNQFSSPASNSNPVNSPMPHGSSNPGGNPPSVKNPMSNSSQTSSTGHLGSPGTLHHPPGQSPLSGANMRLSHFDPAPANGVAGPSSTATSASGSMSSAPATPTAVAPKQPTQNMTQGSSSSSMSNITSASLANLAKGVENLSNQMQQSMVHGGPFHSIQVQGQVGSTPASNSSTSTSGSTPVCCSQATASTTQPGSASSTPKQYINNTNISQVNNFYGVNREAAQSSMEVHAMTMEGGAHVSMTGAGSSATMTNVSTMNGNMGPAGGMAKEGGAFRETPIQQQQQQQQQQQHQAAMMMAGGGGMGVSMAMSQAQMQSAGSVPAVSAPMATMQPGMPPSSQVKSPPYQSHPHPLPLPSMSTGMQQSGMSSSMGGGSGNRLTSPPFPSNSLGNANVHIQPKAPNTIQYLPANPPPTQQPPAQSAMPMAGGPPPAKRAATEMEMMARYNSPMDMKGNPSSTLQYFPNSPPNHTMRPHPGAGPHSGAGVPPMPEFTPQQTMEMQQAMMMRGGAPGAPGPQDFGPMGPMGQGMHPGMSMGPGGPVPSSMHSPLGMERMDMSGMGSPMDPVLMGPGASAMRHATVMGPGGAGSMDPMSSPMPSMMGPAGAAPSGSYPGPAPQGYLPNGQSMMMGQPMQGPGPAGPPGHPVSMSSMPISHSGMPRMPGAPSSMRMQIPGAAGPAGSGGYSAQYQQFQQQLYAQGRPRQMSPHMMGAGPPGPGQPYMGMIPPNMPGAS